MSELCAYQSGICLGETTRGIEGEMHGDTDGWTGLELSPLRGNCNGTTRYGARNPGEFTIANIRQSTNEQGSNCHACVVLAVFPFVGEVSSKCHI